MPSRFGLKTFKAQKIIKEVHQLPQEWQYYFEQHDVGSADIERLKAIIPNIQA